MTLDEIRKLIEAATPGPWGYTYDGSSTWSVGPAEDPQSPQVASLWRGGAAECPDARFIAAARTLLPALLEVAEAAKALYQDMDWGDTYPAIATPDSDLGDKLGKALAALEAIKLP